MEINANQLLLNEDSSAKALITVLNDHQTDLKIDNGFLYYNFPIYRDQEEESSKANVLLVSQYHGVVVFECSDLSYRVAKSSPSKIQEIADKLEQTYSQTYAQLIRSKDLRLNPKELRFSLEQIIYIPNYSSKEKIRFDQSDYVTICRNFNEIKDRLDTIRGESRISLNSLMFKEIVAILEGSKGIIKPKERKLKQTSLITKGKILQEIELGIANFDEDQKRAALNIIDGPQRIRGLAGSGKTIVLTWKAALIHLYHPDAEIVYTFYTKSLYELIRRLITRFYRQHSERDPNWDKIHILHAWGGRNLPGVYSEVCNKNGLAPRSFSEVKFFRQPFDEICKELLKNDLRKSYDYMLIDEAQDFPTNFYRLCYHITRNHRICWAYDECQNILDIEIQDPRRTFGKDESGNYLIDFAKAPDGTRNDIVLHTCYRNPREILIYAFALGLGLYNDPILQMLENNDHWSDLGFKVLKGYSKKDDLMIIERPEENTPLSKNKWLQDQTSFLVKVFDSFQDECDFIAKEIKKDIESELAPDDILVISLDDFYAKQYFSQISQLLAKHGIQTFNLQTAPSISKRFTLAGC